MAGKVSFLVDKLLANYGIMSLYDLQSAFYEEYEENASDLPEIFTNFPLLFKTNGSVGEETCVSVSTNIKQCTYNATRKGCQQYHCPDLHICKYILEGNKCKFGESCKYGHTLQSYHNRKVIHQNDLDMLNLKQICQLIHCTNKPQFPQICQFYNNSRHPCKYERGGSSCPSMHICLHYVEGDCRFGHQKCKRSHNILDPQPSKLLEEYGVNINRSPKEVLDDVRSAIKLEFSDQSNSNTARIKKQTYSWVKQPEIEVPPDAPPPAANGPAVNPEEIQLPSDETALSVLQRYWSTPSCSTSIRSSESNTDKAVNVERQNMACDEICLYHLGGDCFYKERCKNIHSDGPYMWQYLSNSSIIPIWVSFEMSVAIESDFCDPQNMEFTCKESHKLQSGHTFTINFDKMTVKWDSKTISKVRRLSVLSPTQCDKNEEQDCFTTNWIWFYQGYDDMWHEFVKTDVMDVKALENSYVINTEGSFTYSSEDENHKIDFQTMIQTNEETGEVVELRRRPKFNQPIIMTQSETGKDDQHCNSVTDENLSNFLAMVKEESKGMHSSSVCDVVNEDVSPQDDVQIIYLQEKTGIKDTETIHRFYKALQNMPRVGLLRVGRYSPQVIEQMIHTNQGMTIDEQEFINLLRCQLQAHAKHVIGEVVLDNNQLQLQDDIDNRFEDKSIDRSPNQACSDPTFEDLPQDRSPNEERCDITFEDLPHDRSPNQDCCDITFEGFPHDRSPNQDCCDITFEGFPHSRSLNQTCSESVLEDLPHDRRLNETYANKRISYVKSDESDRKKKRCLDDRPNLRIEICNDENKSDNSNDMDHSGHSENNHKRMKYDRCRRRDSRSTIRKWKD